MLLMLGLQPLQYINQFKKNNMKIDVKLEEEEAKTTSKGPFLIENLNPRRKSYCQKKGVWTEGETLKYVVFIQEFQEELDRRQVKELWDLFKDMSKFIGSRNFRQCKIYHFKLYNQFKGTNKIISQLQPTFSQRQYQKEKDYLKEKKGQFFATIHQQEQIPNFAIQQEKDVVKKEDIYLMKTDLEYRNERMTGIQQPLEENAHRMIEKQMRMRKWTNEWEECHSYFMQWVSKMMELMVQYPY